MDENILQPDPRKMNAARESAGITQECMAEIIGVTKYQISHYETGRAEPKGSQLLTWAHACNVTCESLASRAGRTEFYFRKIPKQRLNSIDKLNVVKV